MKRAWKMAVMGPKPMDTVGNCQKAGSNQGCGYDESPPPSTFLPELHQLHSIEASFQTRAGRSRWTPAISWSWSDRFLRTEIWAS